MKQKGKKMITLSRKTLNTKIKIFKNDKEEIELNKDNLYYKIEDNFVDKLILEVNENDAFIEFLSDYGDYRILEDLKKEQFEISKDITIIKIPENRKDFEYDTGLYDTNGKRIFKLVPSVYMIDSLPMLLPEEVAETYPQ